MIIGQTIQHFGISKKYEKYMKLVISFMVVAQIVFAFSTYLKQIQVQGITMSGREYMKEWEIEMQKVEEMAENYNFQVTQKLEEKLQGAEVQRAEEGELKMPENGPVFIEKITIH